MNTIAKPFGWLLMWLYEFTKNYGIAIILFAIVVKLILLPFQVKSKKSMMQTTRLQPQVKELEKKYGDDQQKYNLEVQKLYKAHKINPMSGCFWSLIPLPIMLALYQAIRFPLTIMMGVGKELLEEGGAILAKLTEMDFSTSLSAAYQQIAQSQFITAHFSDFAALSDKLKPIDFSFLGLDLGAQPQATFFLHTDWSNPSVWVSSLCLFLMPIIAAGITILSTKLNSSGSAPADEATGSTFKMLNYTLPLITLIFGFMMPAAICLYWIVNMGLSAIQDAILNKSIKKKIDIEEAEYRKSFAEKEAILEAKRKKTEQLRAENATSQNKNTSKAKIMKNQKDAQKTKTSEWERQNSGEDESKDVNYSKVGNRPYARGRNYDPDRFSNYSKYE